jgi:hypothetical protein
VNEPVIFGTVRQNNETVGNKIAFRFKHHHCDIWRRTQDTGVSSEQKQDNFVDGLVYCDKNTSSYMDRLCCDMYVLSDLSISKVLTIC